MKDERRNFRRLIEKFEKDLYEMGEDLEQMKKKVEEHNVLVKELQYRINKLLAD